MLDLGGVVVKVDLWRVVSALNLDKDDSRVKFFFEIGDWPPYQDYERGRLAEKEFFEMLCDHTGLNENHSQYPEWWCSPLAGEIEGVASLLERLPEETSLLALSNTDPVHLERELSQYPVFKKFSKVLASYDLGCRKPESEIFKIAQKIAGTDPSDILFIDDREENVLAARAAGYRAEWCQDSPSDLERFFIKHQLMAPIQA